MSLKAAATILVLLSVLVAFVAASSVDRSLVRRAFTYRPFTKPGLIGYWPNWGPYSRPQNNIDQLNLDGVSVVCYAFLDLKADGSVASSDASSDATHVPMLTQQVRDKFPNLLTSISVGGYSLSRYFSTVVASDALSRAFAQNIHSYMDANGFDGVDIDYEFPGPNGASCNVVSADDQKNLLNFFKILRQELGNDRLISFVIWVEPSYYISNGVNYLPEYAKYLSYIGVMTYDMYTKPPTAAYTDIHTALGVPGAQDAKRPAANSPVYSTSSSLQNFINAGVNASQLVAGLGFYAHTWAVSAKGDNNGLFQPCDKPGQDLTNPTGCPIPAGDYLDATTTCDFCNPSSCTHNGQWSYFNLRGYNGVQRNAPLTSGPTVASNGWSRAYFDWAQAPTLYNPSFQPTDSAGNAVASAYQAFLTYDDPVSIAAKASWASASGLGGAMMWELSLDFQGELLSAAKSGWAAPSTLPASPPMSSAAGAPASGTTSGSGGTATVSGLGSATTATSATTAVTSSRSAAESSLVAERAAAVGWIVALLTLAIAAAF
ncbi:glycoside hydrolase superfamily [Zopfochytrium polystomum]|nr:glycoside hydrolase superfamily [Zopfochytrium polystomum]